MKCPRCGADTHVTDSRHTPDDFIRRRRACDNGHRFSTYETTYAPSNIRWARKHGTARVAAWREKNPEKVERLRMREEARKEAKRTGEPVAVIYQRWGVG